MNDSEFWRDLAEKFLSIADSTAVLTADWFREGTSSTWTVRGPLIFQAKFGALARRGAMGLASRECPDLLEAWLEALRLNREGFKALTTSLRTGDDKQLTITADSGTIRHLIDASVSFCKKLESLALQAEFERMLVVTATKSAAIPPALNEPKPETIGQQIKRFREECRLTIEELALKVGIEPRSIQRHEADKSTPYPRNVSAYEKVFSKLLKRQIVISKMS